MTLTKLSEQLRGLSRELGHKIAAESADEITRLARETFDAGQDADGIPWRESSVDGRKVDLRETDALRDGLSYKAIGLKLRAALGVGYAKYQVGKRPVFPRGALPPRYVRALSEISRRLSAAWLRGSR